MGQEIAARQQQAPIQTFSAFWDKYVEFLQGGSSMYHVSALR